MQIDRLKMPIGEALFTQRSARKLRPDPIPVEDLHLIMEAAVKAPNGGNHQVGRFLIVNDRAKIREFGALYKEAWWAKRWDDHKWTKPEDIPFEGKIDPKALALPNQVGINVGMADGSVRWINLGTLTPAKLAAAITRAGGEVMNLDDDNGRGESAPFIVPKDATPTKPAPKTSESKPSDPDKKKD